MKTYYFSVICLLSTITLTAQDANRILQGIDRNMSSETQIVEATMIVHGRRNSRTMTSRSFIEGANSFTEYLSPAREAGTKMLKLGAEMWIFSPSTDRTIMISGHMMRQSVMGSDLSYEDMMEDRKLSEVYTATMLGREHYDDRDCFVLLLTAKTDDVAYPTQKMWVDVERMVPLKQELYARSGQLLKRITLSDVRRIDNRWFPMKMNYKDMLNDGNGTDWIITNIQFNQRIDPLIFSKASLR